MPLVGSPQLPPQPLQLLLVPLNHPFLLHPILSQPADLLLQRPALLLAQGCERALGVFWYFEEPEDRRAVVHGVRFSVSSTKGDERARERLTVGFADDTGAGDWCGVESWLGLLGGISCASHLGC